GRLRRVPRGHARRAPRHPLARAGPVVRGRLGAPAVPRHADGGRLLLGPAGRQRDPRASGGAGLPRARGAPQGPARHPARARARGVSRARVLDRALGPRSLGSRSAVVPNEARAEDRGPPPACVVAPRGDQPTSGQATALASASLLVSTHSGTAASSSPSTTT